MLYEYYDLDECTDLSMLKRSLNAFRKDGKIDYEITESRLRLTDLDLTENEIDDILDLFDTLSIFENIEYEDEDDDLFDSLDEYDNWEE